MRYKFYREHKYVSAAVNDVERLIAKTDFRVRAEVEKVKHEFDALVGMLKGHAHYENDALHSLLKKKNSAVYMQIEDDHKEYDETLANLDRLLTKAMESASEKEQVENGYQFYLWFRKFAGDNLLHLHEEETIILPELQRLYSDEELREVEAKTYKVMTAQELVEMMEVLFPHMNPSDHEAFLSDIKCCEPEKFAQAWVGIQARLEPRERDAVAKKLGIV